MSSPAPLFNGSERAELVVPVPQPRFNFERSLGGQRFGAFDPTASLDRETLTKAYHGPMGPLVARASGLGDSVRLEIAGPGAHAELQAWTSCWPPSDGYADFAPTSATVNRLHRSLPGLRILRQPWLFDVACQTILQQRVTWKEALGSWRRMARAMGTPCGEHFSFPAPARLGRVNPASLAAFDIDLRRASAIVALARAELAMPFLGTATGYDSLRARLTATPGVGQWTTEYMMGKGAGDPDAVPTGDLHMPHAVSWALAGEARGSDDRMVELLEPYRGQRFRVLRLLSAGKLKAPRFGPRKPRRTPR